MRKNGAASTVRVLIWMIWNRNLGDQDEMVDHQVTGHLTPLYLSQI